MSDSPKTVFISYRRSVSIQLAQNIFHRLRSEGYDVFLDIESIGSGKFERIILNEIPRRAYFIVILTHGTLERCKEPNDVLRREIECAIEHQRNIVPILVNCFEFDSSEKTYLTGKLSVLSEFNGMTLYYDYFDAAIDRLVNRFLKEPIYGTIAPTSPEQRREVETIIEEAAAQPPPTQEELSAEQLFLRAYEKYSVGDLDGAIADYTEAIRFNPKYVDAYIKRGLARRKIGDLNGAIIDYNRALELEPENASIYNKLGVTRRHQGNLKEAIASYNRALKLNPIYATGYNNRGEAYFALSQFDMALSDFEKALEFKPYHKYATAGLAITHHALGNISEARRLWRKLLEKDDRYRDVEWVKKELNWPDPLVDEARKLIARLDDA